MTREQLPPELPFDEEGSPQVEEDEPQAHICASSRSFSTWPCLIVFLFVIIANTATTGLLTIPIAFITWFFFSASLFPSFPAGTEREKELYCPNSDKIYVFQAVHVISSLIIGQIWTVYVLLRKGFVDETLESSYDFLLMQRRPAVRRYLVCFTCVFLGLAVSLLSFPSITAGCNEPSTSRPLAGGVFGEKMNEEVQDAGLPDLPDPPIPSGFAEVPRIPGRTPFSLPLCARRNPYDRYGTPPTFSYDAYRTAGATNGEPRKIGRHLKVMLLYSGFGLRGKRNVAI